MINSMRYAILLVFCLIATMSYSQKKRVIEFGEDSDNAEIEEFVYASMAVKLAPFNFLNGNFPIFFEKEASNFGLQIGLGPTFKRYFDIYSELNHSDGLSVSEGLPANIESFIFPSFNIENTTASVGLYATLEGKYYYSEDGLDGSYFGVKGTYYKYNLDDNIELGSSSTSDRSGFDKYRTLSFIWGSQIARDLAIYESFLGVGLNWMNRQRHVEGNFGGGFQEGDIIYNGTQLVFELGFRVGFQLR